MYVRDTCHPARMVTALSVREKFTSRVAGVNVLFLKHILVKLRSLLAFRAWGIIQYTELFCISDTELHAEIQAGYGCAALTTVLKR